MVYTVEEVAELLRIGRSAAYEAVRRGQIPALRFGRRLRIPRSALDQLLRIHTSLEHQNEKLLISDDGCER
ncbi:MAG: helix-turn-helix domain-containing protein [Actinobacteria bacterium]|nr:helix-turn-helix domain-containing protein [Actinomycetota bacterium]